MTINESFSSTPLTLASLTFQKSGNLQQMWKQLFQVSSFLFVKEILADLRKLTVRCECKKYSFHIHMLQCVRSSCGTLFSCVSHFHAFTGAHEILCLFIVLFRHLLVIFCRLYGFPSWKLSWPLNESVKIRPVHILLVRKISLIILVIYPKKTI